MINHWIRKRQNKEIDLICKYAVLRGCASRSKETSVQIWTTNDRDWLCTVYLVGMDWKIIYLNQGKLTSMTTSGYYLLVYLGDAIEKSKETRRIREESLDLIIFCCGRTVQQQENAKDGLI